MEKLTQTSLLDLLAAYSTCVFPADQAQAAARDKICPEWRTCKHGEICMDDTINLECVCYLDEPDKLPGGPAPLPEDISDVFSRDQRKVLAAGFALVRYTRDAKLIQVSEADLCNGWCSLDTFKTYAEAERKLKELKSRGHIETDLRDKIVMSGWNQPGGLLKAGFEFYRCYGLGSPQEGNYCIKVGSRNWSNLAKYDAAHDLCLAWDALMTNDPKALEG